MLLQKHREQVRHQKLVAKIKEIQGSDNAHTSKFYRRKNRTTGKKRAVFKEHASSNLIVDETP